MENYADLDEATLKEKAAAAETYEERALLRQALRQKKKERGEQPAKRTTRASAYNRFAATSRSTAATPKNYVASSQSVNPNSEPPAQRPPKQAKDEKRPASPPREPTPPPTEPTPPPREPTPPPRDPTPPPTPEDEEDGCSDPDLGEEDVPVATTEESEEERAESPPDNRPKAKDRAIEEDTDIGVPSRSKKAAQTKVDFGVKLKATPPKTQSKPSARPSPSGGGPRTLRDYQELAAHSSKPTQRPVTPEDRPLGNDELQQYLVAYVNKELGVRPPMPAKGRALFETASDPTNLCKLINKSVANTVDLRALTKMPVRGSSAAKKEALEENMVLVVESARAIGCRVVDDLAEKLLSGDPDTIRQFLVDLIRARVVHMPDMEDESSFTFTNLPLLFSKLDIRLESVDGEDTPPPPQEPVTSPVKESLTYEERAALRKAERERKKSNESSSTSEVQEEMTYEERATKRRQERERRRREREALAN